ncbi:hypothetical protein GKC29_08145 [Micromonospora sp. WMMC415]|uniref:hypothetical protein n=1 Tax=Micromonospora sp. WMMC415 TaxID=2675222 RepID=UPI0012B4D46B|nr:hypothetical protein [Micromonospora sp. WMMC415]QGN46821.1 hypothetical protein GKC29_08145 [Micromonospora sp. WMMC415]
MISKHTIARAGAILALIVAGFVAVPASAASAASCDVHIGTTRKSGSQIVGYGSIQGCSSSSIATLSIQKQTCIGCWSTLKTARVNGPGYDQYIYYNCSGTGTQTYRTTISGNTIGGGYKFKASNSIRVSC